MHCSALVPDSQVGGSKGVGESVTPSHSPAGGKGRLKPRGAVDGGTGLWCGCGGFGIVPTAERRLDVVGFGDSDSVPISSGLLTSAPRAYGHTR